MKKISNVLFLYFFVFVMCMGASFAWYVWQGANVNVNVVFSSVDKYINYETSVDLNGNEDGITASVDYTEGVIENIDFTKKDIAKNLDLYGSMYLKIDECDSSTSSNCDNYNNLFKSSSLKWTLVSVNSSNVETEISTGNFVGEAVGNEIPMYINFELDESITYKTYIWIDQASNHNLDISGLSLNTSIVSESKPNDATTTSMNEELYVTRVEYGGGYITDITLYSSMYPITGYMFTTGSIPSADDSGWTSVDTGTSIEEHVLDVEVNQEMSETTNVCVKNSNNKVYCKSVGEYDDTVDVTYNSNNLLYNLVDVSNVTATNMVYSVSNGVVTVTGKDADGYGYTNGRVYLEAGKEYLFSCDSSGTWGSSVQAFLMLDGDTATYYHMAGNDNYAFTPEVTGTYWLRLDVNAVDVTHTFSNINISYNADVKSTMYGYPYGTLPTITRVGYTHNGWYNAASGGTQITSTTTMSSSSDHTIYSQWTANTYTVAYSNTCSLTKGGSTANSTHTYEVYKNLTANGYTCSAKVTYDYQGATGGNTNASATATSTFNGWATTSGGSVVYSNSESVVNLATSGTKTLYTNWTNKSVTCPTPTRTGYTFNGWYTAASGGTKVCDAGGTYTPDAGTKTIYAQWTANTYKITYALNGGTSGTNAPTSGTYDSVVTISNPTKSGYTFTGWTYSNGDTSTALYGTSSSAVTTKWSSASTQVTAQYFKNLTATSGATVTMTAHWKKTLTATFNYYNSASTTSTCDLIDTATSCSATAPAALGTPDGYTFRGWSTADTANATISVAASGSITLSANATYYASYQQSVTATFYYSTLASDTLTYSGHTASTTTATAVKYINYQGTIVNSNFTVPTAVTGSTGGGAAPNYKGVSSSASSAVITTPTTANTKYYAVYYEDLVFYYYNGSAQTSKSVVRVLLCDESTYATALWNTSFTAADSAPTSSDYDSAEFVSWSYTDTSINARTPTQTGVNALYAVHQKTITVTYNANGGSDAPSSQTGTKSYIIKASGVTTLNPSITLSTTIPIKTGYTFSGWNTASDGSGTSYSAGTAYEISSNTTLYAQWTINSYTLTVKPNGGTWNSVTTDSTFTQNYNTTKSIAVPSVNAYYTISYNVNGGTSGTPTATKAYRPFTGWTLSGSGSITSTTPLATSTQTYTFGAGAGTLTAGYNSTASSTTTASVTRSYTITYNENSTSATVTASDASKVVNYTMNGWYTAASGGTKRVSNGGSYAPTASETVYAQWSAGTTTLATLSKTGYTCTWNTKSDGSGTSYASGKTGYTTSAAVTLYAVCTPNTYSVTLNNQSATSAGTTKVYYQYNTTQTINGVTCYYYTDSALTTCLDDGYNIVNPTKTGWSFNGYFTSTGGSGTQYVNSSGSFINNVYKTTGDKTLYAYWIDDIAPSTPTYSAFYDDGSGTYTSGTWATKQVNTTLTSTDSGTGVAYFQYQKNGGSWTTLSLGESGGLSVSGTTGTGTEAWSVTNGRNDTIYFRACDSGEDGVAKNDDDNCSGSSAVYNIKYDTAAPTTPTITTMYDLWGSRTYSISGGYSSDAGTSGTWTTTSNDPYIMFDDVSDISGITGAYVELEEALSTSITIQIFYAPNGDGSGYSGNYHTDVTLSAGQTKIVIPFNHSGTYTKVRFDVGTASGLSYKIKHLGVIATANQWNRDDIILQVSTTESGSGVAYWQYTYSSSATTTGTDSSSTWVTHSSSASSTYIPSSYSAERNQYTYVRACDSVGNCSSAASTYIKIDKTKPTVSAYAAYNLFPTKSPNTTNVMTVSGTTLTTTGNDPFIVFSSLNISNVTKAVVTLSSGASSAFTFQVFYATSGVDFSETNSVKVSVSSGQTVIEVDLPGGTYTAIRFDFGGTSGVTFNVAGIDLVGENVSNVGYVHANITDSSSGVSAYTVTTSSDTPSSFTDITDASSYHVRYSASAGTYYVWGKDVAGNIASGSATTKNLVDSTAPTVTITRSDYNTFSWSASDNVAVTGYAVTTSSSTPTSWTTSGTLTSGTYDVSSAGTYYVWVKDAAGNTNSASIGAYTVTRSVGTGSTLTTRYDSTSSSTGTAFTSNTVVLSGTNVWAQATENTGYITPVLKRAGSTVTNPSYASVTAAVTIASSATAKPMYVYYNVNGGTMTETTDGGTFTTDSDGFIYKDGNVQFFSISPGSTTGSSGFVNWNNGEYIYITKSGYSVTSGSEWNTNAAGTGTSFSHATEYSYSNLLSYATDKDTYYRLDLYVKWVANTYTITYYIGNGTSTAGTSQLGTSTCTYNASCTLTTFADLGGVFPYSSADNTANGNTNYNWSFYGWSTSQTGTSRSSISGTALSNGATFTYSTVGNVSLYAIGRKPFYFNTGIAPTASSSTKYQYWNPYSTSTTYMTSITIPTQTDITGWTFIGYRGGSSSASSTVTFAASTVGTSQKPAYNTWGTNRSVYSRTLTISYNGNNATSGSTSSTTATQYYNSGYGSSSANNGANVSTPTFTLASNGFTKTNYRFVSWTAGSTSGTAYSAGASFTGFTPAVDSTTTTYTMYAKWAWNAYAVYSDSSMSTFVSYQSSLSAAVNAVSTGGGIKVLQSNTSSSDITINKNITINTNGKTITSTKLITNSGTLTLTGSGTITNSTTNVIENTGTLTINGPTISTSGTLTAVAVVSGTVTMSSGTVQADHYAIRARSMTGNVTMNVTGGTLTTNTTNASNFYVSPFSIGSSDSYKATVTISGGTFSSKGYTIVNSDADSTVTITKGTFQTVAFDSSTCQTTLRNSSGTLSLGTSSSTANSSNVTVINSCGAYPVYGDSGTFNYNTGYLYSTVNYKSYDGFTTKNIRTGYKATTVSDSTYGYKTYLVVDSFANYITNLYDSGTATSVTTSGGEAITQVTAQKLMKDSAGNIRYYGASPNNYVTFNGETWRIIGVFSGYVKLIRSASVKTQAWNSDYGDWVNSSMYTYLNDTYLTSMTTTAQNMLASATWYLGGLPSFSGYYADDYYNRERGSTISDKATATTVSAKVGLMYVSDYNYATDLSVCTKGAYWFTQYDSDITNCRATDWLYLGANEWTIVHLSVYYDYAVYINSSGIPTGTTVTSTYGTRPVVYLSTSVYRSSGSGTSSSPYILAKG